MLSHKNNQSTSKSKKAALVNAGANPTIASYNASVVKIYSTVNSMARF
jgi:hypothetical protein